MLDNKLTYLISKRILDILLSIILIILLSPLLIFIPFFIKATSSGPIIHWSKRVGENNKFFFMPKFRSMYVFSPNVATHLISNPDQYLTKIGSFLRKYSLDELPQLFTVLSGTMSIVGPRPALYNQFDLIDLRTKERINKLKTGITGWAQIHGRDNISIYLKVKHDKYYLENKSIFLDLLIIFRSISKVIKKESISH